MHGVVLWSDHRLKTAVIWCEDHGDLAFLTADDDGFDDADIAHGDVISFDIDPQGAFRRARNARVVDPEAYPLLARSLKDGLESQQCSKDERDPGAGTDPALSSVVSFAAPSGAQTEDRMRRTGR